MMDTVVTVTLYDGGKDTLNGVLDLCSGYEKMFSRTVEESDISRINKSNGEPVTVSDETAGLIKLSLAISEKSEGAFDITVTPLTELWNVNERTAVPKDEEIASALKYVGHKNVSVDGTTVTVKNGAKLDLGGIAKGYIADKAYDYLKSHGIKNAVINLGGNVKVLGDGKKGGYTVGIQKPFAENGTAELTVKLSDKTAVTSGIYERFFEADGKIWHHVLDPSTGYPADNGIASVTVIAESSAIADGLSTACLVLGREKGIALAESCGAELIMIFRDGTHFVTDGIKNNVKE